MAQHSLGAVTTNAGTIVRTTANESDPTRRYPAHSYLVQVFPTNTGLVFVGGSDMDVSTGVGVYATLGAPTSATSTPSSFGAGQANVADAINMADVYLDVAVNGEGAIVSIMRG